MFERKTRVKKTYRVNQMEPGPYSRLDYILLPIGYFYNAEWGRARKGDRIKFFNGGSYRIASVRKISLKRLETDLLCRMRYGISLTRAIQQWRLNAFLEGNGKNSISSDECLWIFYEKGGNEEEGGEA